MRRINRFSLAFSVLLMAALACNFPQPTPIPSEGPNAAFTAAAQTVSAQLTQSAGNQPPTSTPGGPPATNTSVPPTFTPLPTNTNQPTPTTECDKAQFISDVTVPDGTSIVAGQAFTKTWRIKNIGTCTWAGYSLVFDSGDSMGGVASSAIANTPPGGTVDISIDLTAPATLGNYRGYWRIRSTSGYLLPVINGYQVKSFYVDIKVVSGGSTFAVTNINYILTTWSDAGHTNCPRVIAQITVNGAGTVSFKWTRADTPAGGAVQTVTFAAAGTKNVRYDWARGSVWAGTPTWVGIYVTDPNNQNFGHLVFNEACTVP